MSFETGFICVALAVLELCRPGRDAKLKSMHYFISGNIRESYRSFKDKITLPGGMAQPLRTRLTTKNIRAQFPAPMAVPPGTQKRQNYSSVRNIFPSRIYLCIMVQTNGEIREQM